MTIRVNEDAEWFVARKNLKCNESVIIFRRTTSNIYLLPVMCSYKKDVKSAEICLLLKMDQSNDLNLVIRSLKTVRLLFDLYGIS